MRNWALVIITSGIVMLAIAPVTTVIQAYSDSTQEIHRFATCDSDGFCRPEFYVVLDDPAVDGTLEVDYIPSVDPHFWYINTTGILNITVDAQENYDVRGCATFFVDCPSTTHLAWLTGSNQCVLTVGFSSDVDTSFRMVNVPQPDQVLIDGASATIVRYGDGIEVLNVTAGSHELIFTNPECNPCGRTQGLGITFIAIILLIIWLAFTALGIALANMTGGLLMFIGSLVGLALGALYLLPCVSAAVSIVFIALAMVTLLYSIGIMYDSGGQ